MPSAGEMLRSERLKQGMDLVEVAARTRISRRYLEAIEADTVHELPGEFFYKAFIRQYAEALALNSSETGRILSAAVPMSEPNPVPVLSHVYARTHADDAVRWQPSTGVAVVVLLTVVAGGSLLYAWWQRSQVPAELAASSAPASRQRTAAPPEASQPKPAQPPAAGPAAAATDASPQQSVPAPASSAPDTPPPAAVPSGQHVLEIAAIEPAWVQVSSAGRTVFIGTLQAREKRQFPTADNATLRTGNAGALEVHWDGKAIGEVGPAGQVRVVHFTPQGMEIETPRAKNVSGDTPAQP